MGLVCFTFFGLNCWLSSEDELCETSSILRDVCGVGLPTTPAAAHPHVWATVHSEIVFGSDRQITGIRHAWTFDEFYTAMAIQGLDAPAISNLGEV
jgi:ABC-type uncharacterized transport system substrate-binding protein